MTENEKNLEGLKAILGEEAFNSLSKEDLQTLLNNSSDMVLNLDTKKEVKSGLKNFEDYCPDLMKNEKAAQWIEKEGDRARVFAVKMAGLRDNPSVSDNIKKMISTPEDVVELYQNLDKKLSYMQNNELEEIFTYATDTNDLEKYKYYSKKFNDLNSYNMLLENDKNVLSPKHWEQCYSMTANVNEALLETLEDEARIFEEKKVALKKTAAKTTPEAEAIKKVENQAEKSAAKLEQKVAVKTGTAVVIKSGKAAATKQIVDKSIVLAKAKKANMKFDKAVDKVIEKGTEKLNNSKTGKAYEKAAEKVGNTKAGKAVGAAAGAVAKKAAETTAGKAVGKVVTKAVGTAVGKSVLKKIPVVSAFAGSYFAYERIKNGEFKAAGCEFLSGVAGCFPGVGTAVSVGLDAGLAANDIHQAVKSAKADTPKKTSAPTKKYVAKAQSKPVKQATTPSKKTVRKTTLSTEQMLALNKQNGRA
ncbi:MAG: hypothetical protein J6C85_04840 [Alphaproteobacteria bacterium]|nr:hypothetical protein [Alphaproteobacteria bacterium]